jgi:hypothetical protein
LEIEGRMKNWFEVRVYNTGWVVSIGPIWFQWNRQVAYKEFSIAKRRPQHTRVGGRVVLAF